MAASNGPTKPSLTTFSLSQSCPIHFGPFKDARTLPCGHSFCFECLLPYSSTNRVVCPLCNAVHRTDIYMLPALHSLANLGRYLLGALPAKAEEQLTKSKVVSAEKALVNAESACDMVIELLEAMKEDFKDMKSGFQQNRRSLEDELKQLEQSNCSGLTEQEKVMESRNLATACDVFQRVCTMAQDRAFHRVLHVSKEVEDVCQRVKSIGICRYYVDSEMELDESTEKEIISCLASLVQSYANCNDTNVLCEHMIQSFPHQFSTLYTGRWTAVVGDQSLVWEVPYTMLIHGQTSKRRMVIYCSTRIGKDSTHKLGMRVSQTRFKSIIQNEYKEKKLCDQELITRISKRVAEEFGGIWHCIAGNKASFVARSTEDRSFLLRQDIEEKEWVCWKHCTSGDDDKQTGLENCNNERN